jgi:hypothetical protein
MTAIVHKGQHVYASFGSASAGMRILCTGEMRPFFHRTVSFRWAQVTCPACHLRRRKFHTLKSTEETHER